MKITPSHISFFILGALCILTVQHPRTSLLSGSVPTQHINLSVHTFDQNWIKLTETNISMTGFIPKQWNIERTYNVITLSTTGCSMVLTKNLHTNVSQLPDHLHIANKDSIAENTLVLRTEPFTTFKNTFEQTYIFVRDFEIQKPLLNAITVTAKIEAENSDQLNEVQKMLGTLRFLTNEELYPDGYKKT